MNDASLSYAKAGVDIDAGDAAVELMKEAVARSYNANVVSPEGGFAGLVDVSVLKDYRRPLLATSTDGVGTKVAIAQALDIHDTIGQDLVAMVVDDIVVVGARPMLMTDYIACGKVNPARIADIVRGVAQACAQVDTPLLGGETAEHPGLMGVDDYDIAGAATGVVEADRQLGAHRVREGDVLVALASSGLHSNGFSLVRAIIEHAGWSLERHVDNFGRTLGEELLEPTRLYSAMCLEMLGDGGSGAHDCGGDMPVHALSHITGGGLGANISRIMPRGMAAVIDRASWKIPPVFSLMQQLGNVAWEDMEQTLNLGVGMVAICPPDTVDEAIRVAGGYGTPAWVLGEVVREDDAAGTALQRATNDPFCRTISGAKGAHGGSCTLFGHYRAD